MAVKPLCLTGVSTASTVHGHHSTEKPISELVADGTDPSRISAHYTTIVDRLAFSY